MLIQILTNYELITAKHLRLQCDGKTVLVKLKINSIESNNVLIDADVLH